MHVSLNRRRGCICWKPRLSRPDSVTVTDKVPPCSSCSFCLVTVPMFSEDYDRPVESGRLEACVLNGAEILLSTGSCCGWAFPPHDTHRCPSQPTLLHRGFTRSILHFLNTLTFYFAFYSALKRALSSLSAVKLYRVLGSSLTSSFTVLCSLQLCLVWVRPVRLFSNGLQLGFTLRR